MPRSKNIAFLRLPQVVQRRVAASMDSSSLVFMSLSSSKLEKIVRSVQHENNLHLEFNLRANRSTLTLFNKKDAQVVWVWKKFEKGEEMTSENLRLDKDRVIHPTCTPIAVREYLEGLFGYRMHLSFYVKKGTAFNIKFVQHVGHIIYLVIYGEDVIQAREARRLFNLYGRPIRFVAVQTPGLSFPEGHLVYQSLDLTYMDSSKEHMNLFRGRRAFYLDSDCKEEDLVFFVRRWLESGDMNLQEIYVIETGLVATWNKDLILEQFETTEWDPKLRAGTYINPSKPMSCCSNVDFRSGRDIMRYDGVLATIKAMRGMFYFVVWHDRFPDCSQ